MRELMRGARRSARGILAFGGCCAPARAVSAAGGTIAVLYRALLVGLNYDQSIACQVRLCFNSLAMLYTVLLTA